MRTLIMLIMLGAGVARGNLIEVNLAALEREQVGKEYHLTATFAYNTLSEPMSESEQTSEFWAEGMVTWNSGVMDLDARDLPDTWESPATLIMRPNELEVRTDLIPRGFEGVSHMLQIKLQAASGVNIHGSPPQLPDDVVIEMCDPVRGACEMQVWNQREPEDSLQSRYGGPIPLTSVSSVRFETGDSNRDGRFNQLDIVQVLARGRYLQAGNWNEGDWNADGVFGQKDIVAALQTGSYLSGTYAAIAPGDVRGDEQTSMIYDATTGEIAVDAPASTELTSINLDSAAGIFTGDPPKNIGGTFCDFDPDRNIFKATFGGSFGSVTFGYVAQTGLSQDFLAGDLTVVGSLNGGGDLGDVDLIYIPEPSSLLLALLGIVGLLHWRR